VALAHESLVSRDTPPCTSRGSYKAPHMILDTAQPTRALLLLFADDAQCHGGPQTGIARLVDRA